MSERESQKTTVSADISASARRTVTWHTELIELMRRWRNFLFAITLHCLLLSRSSVFSVQQAWSKLGFEMLDFHSIDLVKYVVHVQWWVDDVHWHTTGSTEDLWFLWLFCDLWNYPTLHFDFKYILKTVQILISSHISNDSTQHYTATALHSAVF